MLTTTTNFPRGAMAQAAKRLEVSRTYIKQVVQGDYGATDRVIEVLKVLDEVSAKIQEESKQKQDTVDSIRSKYAA